MNPNDPNNPTPSGTPQPPAPAAQPAQGVSIEQFNALADSVKQMGGFVEDAAFILSGIYADPGLRSAVQTKFGQNAGNPPVNPPNPQNPQNPPANPQNPPQNPNPQPPANPNPTPSFDPRVTDVDVKMREDIISRVEQKYGYGNLGDAQRKELRRNVEKQLNGWNSSVLSAPVNQLGKLLEDAYLLQDLGKAKEEGRVQGLIDAHQSNMGALPTMPNAAPSQDTTALNPAQQKWTQRWGLNADKVTDKLKEFQETGMVTYHPPTPTNPTQPAPSGNPTPPVAAPAVSQAVPNPAPAQ